MLIGCLVQSALDFLSAVCYILLLLDSKGFDLVDVQLGLLVFATRHVALQKPDTAGILLCKNSSRQSSKIWQAITAGLAFPIYSYRQEGFKLSHIYICTYALHIIIYIAFVHCQGTLCSPASIFSEAIRWSARRLCSFWRKYPGSHICLSWLLASATSRSKHAHNTSDTGPITTHLFHSTIFYYYLQYFYLTSTHMSKEPFSPDGLMVPVKPLYHGCICFIGFLSAWICSIENQTAMPHWWRCWSGDLPFPWSTSFFN